MTHPSRPIGGDGYWLYPSYEYFLYPSPGADAPQGGGFRGGGQKKDVLAEALLAPDEGEFGVTKTSTQGKGTVTNSMTWR